MSLFLSSFLSFHRRNLFFFSFLSNGDDIRRSQIPFLSSPCLSLWCSDPHFACSSGYWISFCRSRLPPPPCAVVLPLLYFASRFHSTLLPFLPSDALVRTSPAVPALGSRSAVLDRLPTVVLSSLYFASRFHSTLRPLLHSGALIRLTVVVSAQGFRASQLDPPPPATVLPAIYICCRFSAKKARKELAKTKNKTLKLPPNLKKVKNHLFYCLLLTFQMLLFLDNQNHSFMHTLLPTPSPFIYSVKLDNLCFVSL